MKNRIIPLTYCGLRYLLLLVAIGLFSSQLQAACEEPEAPDLPDPETAVLAEMVKAQKDVKKFISEGEEYLKCQKGVQKYNRMVEQMKEVGDNFNASIKAFKARKSK